MDVDESKADLKTDSRVVLIGFDVRKISLRAVGLMAMIFEIC